MESRVFRDEAAKPLRGCGDGVSGRLVPKSLFPGSVLETTTYLPLRRKASTADERVENAATRPAAAAALSF
jgi:hypothetical protein